MEYEDMMRGMGSLFEKALGRKVDPEALIREMRAAGGIHGPVHPHWAGMLEQIGWEVEGYDDNPRRLEPAFRVSTKSTGVSFPVVCEAYAYLPGDAEDDLVNEAKRKLAGRFPEGVLLLFKTIPYKEVAGKRFSFGGLFYRHEQWRPFAISEAVNSLEALLEQCDGRFSFNEPDPRYEDAGALIARSFNVYSHGCDPEDNPKMVSLRQGDWHNVIPG